MRSLLAFFFFFFLMFFCSHLLLNVLEKEAQAAMELVQNGHTIHQSVQKSWNFAIIFTGFRTLIFMQA